MKLSYEQLEAIFIQTREELVQTKEELVQNREEMTQTREEMTQTREELVQTTQDLESARGELSDLKKQFEKTSEVLKLALQKIAELEEKLNLNSKNSSKPPSTDQKANTTPTERKKRKSRKGIARSKLPPERVDNTIECTCENCPHCGSQLLEKLEISEVLQQVELPVVRAIVTEYLLCKYKCNGCGKKTSACLPAGVPDSAFGPRLMGLFATLTGTLHVAKREAIQLIKDLYDVDIGLGSAPNIEERVSKALDPVYHRIHGLVINSAFCKHFDETTWRNSGKRCYVWVASCSKAAFFKLHAHRSSEAFKDLVGKEIEALAAVTDRYAVYAAITKTHQYCLAHLIRDFRRYAERDGPDKETGIALERELKLVCKIHGDYRDGNISKEQRNLRIGRRKRIIELLLYDGFANGSAKLSGLCDNLLNNFHKLWTFTKVEGMEPTNNLAERDLRKLVIWRKKSFGTRSNRGQKFVERITSVVETAKKHGKNALKFVQESVEKFFLKQPAPYICENLGI